MWHRQHVPTVVAVLVLVLASATQQAHALVQDSSSGGSSTADAAAENQTALVTPMHEEAIAVLVEASAQLALQSDTLTPVQLYKKRLVSRILLLLSDAAWIVYTVGLLARALLALLVPLVPIARAGVVTLDALSLLNWGQLAAEVVARLGDVLSKVFLLISHAVAPV